MKTLIRGIINSADILLLSMATSLLIANLTSPSCYVPCSDPLLNLKLSTLFWIIGGIETAAGMYCIFGKKESLKLVMILWLGINAMGCWIGLIWTNATSGFTGYLGDVADAFGLSCSVPNNLLCATIACLLIGSFVGLILKRIGIVPLHRGQLNEPMPSEQIKRACAHYGGRIQFTSEWFAQTIPCPHCQKPINLQKKGLPNL